MTLIPGLRVLRDQVFFGRSINEDRLIKVIAFGDQIALTED